MFRWCLHLARLILYRYCAYDDAIRHVCASYRVCEDYMCLFIFGAHWFVCVEKSDVDFCATKQTEAMRARRDFEELGAVLFNLGGSVNRCVNR